jgi:hypothetical protein
MAAREKSSQSRAIYSLALRDEKNRQVCLIIEKEEA